MKLVKSLLLGSAAGIVAVAGASAADLPNKKSAPIEYVRVCSEHGKGFFYVPGSDICIQIGGRVRADTLYNQNSYRQGDAVGFGALFQVALDVRQNTAYGTVRAFLRAQLAHSVSNLHGGDYVTATGLGGNSNTAGGSGVDRAFIQFAGLTAGRVQSFFDFYADNYNFAAIRNSDVATQVLAYTANFGNGWSFTGALEDGNERRMIGSANRWSGYSAAGAWSGFTAPLYAGGYTSAGQTVPDVVGSLNVEQSWGAAQLAAALHQVRPAFGGTNYDNKETTYGWAVKGGVKLNLAMIAPGDELWLEAAYSQGALGYIGANNYGFMPTLNLPVADAFVGTNGGIKLNRGFSVTADFLHYWTPSLRSNLFASYMKIDTDRNAYGTDGVLSHLDGTFSSFNYGFVPVSEFRVGTNLIWSPVKNFDIGIEALYTRADPKGRVLDYNNGLPVKTIGADDQWQGRLRVQRDF